VGVCDPDGPPDPAAWAPPKFFLWRARRPVTWFALRFANHEDLRSPKGQGVGLLHKLRPEAGCPGAGVWGRNSNHGKQKKRLTESLDLVYGRDGEWSVGRLLAALSREVQVGRKNIGPRGGFSWDVTSVPRRSDPLPIARLSGGTNPQLPPRDPPGMGSAQLRTQKGEGATREIFALPFQSGLFGQIRTRPRGRQKKTTGPAAAPPGTQGGPKPAKNRNLLFGGGPGGAPSGGDCRRRVRSQPGAPPKNGGDVWHAWFGTSPSYVRSGPPNEQNGLCAAKPGAFGRDWPGADFQWPRERLDCVGRTIAWPTGRAAGRQTGRPVFEAGNSLPEKDCQGGGGPRRETRDTLKSPVSF